MAKSRGKSPVAKEMAVATGLGNCDFFAKKERKTSNPCEAFSSLSSVRRAVDLGRRVWPVSLSTRWACREKNCGQKVDGFRIQNLTVRQFSCLKLNLFFFVTFRVAGPTAQGCVPYRGRARGDASKSIFVLADRERIGKIRKILENQKV